MSRYRRSQFDPHNSFSRAFPESQRCRVLGTQILKKSAKITQATRKSLAPKMQMDVVLVENLVHALGEERFHGLKGPGSIRRGRLQNQVDVFGVGFVCDKSSIHVGVRKRA